MFEENTKKLKIIFLTAVLLGAVMFVINVNIKGTEKESQDNSTSECTYFRDFNLHVFDRENGCESEEIFTEEDLKSCKVALFNVWGPWCSPCVREMPDLQNLADEYESKGLLVVGIVGGYYSSPSTNSDEMIYDVLREENILYPNLTGDERIADEIEPLMIGGYPASWAVDSDGNVIEFVQGAKKEESWRLLFDKWLEEVSDER